MSLSFKEQTTKKNFEMMLTRDFGCRISSRKSGKTTLYYAPVFAHIIPSYEGETDRHIASWESGTGWIFKESAQFEIKVVAAAVLEDLKLFMRNNRVDVTSINKHTAQHMTGNPHDLCIAIEMFEPNNVQQPEIKTRLWAYPVSRKLWVEAPSISVHDWPGLQTAIYNELRSHGFVDRAMKDWLIEVC